MLIAVATATTSVVRVPSATRRRCGVSAHTPITGASRKTRTPPRPIIQPSSPCGTPSGSPAPTRPVRYGVKMNITITVLKAAEPQSNAAHAAIRPREVGVSNCRPGPGS
ncbi:Uncharacterised protein [Mycobacteroides abscessus subsp. abscessus]|nr:Uncharacterised protein [Mycobacteroides abscessus subsp. abscessus]